MRCIKADTKPNFIDLNGKTEFKQYKSLTTKRELDNLDDIKIALGIDKEAVSVYELKAR